MMHATTVGAVPQIRLPETGGSAPPLRPRAFGGMGRGGESVCLSLEFLSLEFLQRPREKGDFPLRQFALSLVSACAPSDHYETEPHLIMSNLIVVLFLTFASPRSPITNPGRALFRRNRRCSPPGKQDRITRATPLSGTRISTQILRSRSNPLESSIRESSRRPGTNALHSKARPRSSPGARSTSSGQPRSAPTALPSLTLLFSFAGNPPASGAFPLWKCGKLLPHHIPREAIHTS